MNAKLGQSDIFSTFFVSPFFLLKLYFPFLTLSEVILIVVKLRLSFYVLKMMMMPVFPVAPWVPNFGGPNSELKYGDWKETLRGLVQYVQTEQQRVGVLMGALTGKQRGRSVC